MIQGVHVDDILEVFPVAHLRWLASRERMICPRVSGLTSREWAQNGRHESSYSRVVLF